MKSIQVKVGGLLALVLLLTFGLSPLVFTLQTGNLPGEQAEHSLDSLQKTVYGQANSIFTSLEPSTKTSVEQGEMEIFQDQLNELSAIPGGQEI